MQFLEKLRKMRENIEILKLVAMERRGNYLVSETNYLTAKLFTEKFIHKKMKTEREALMNKPAYLGLSMQD